MARFRVDSLAALARGFGFAPTAKRLAQLAAAENLLLAITPEKAYPVGYVVHAITRYRPKTADVEDADLVPGEALQHDLGLLVESVSDAMNLAATDLGEPVLTIEDVCARFGVTSKTIQRWRRKGLPARRVLFSGDKKRIGFRLSCVEQFIANQDGAAGRSASVGPLSAAMQSECVRRARLLARGGHSRDEVIRRVARRLGRSSLAVLHTLEQQDRRFAGGSILGCCDDPLTPAELDQVVALHKQSLPLQQIARRLARRNEVVYRALTDVRAERLAAATVQHHDDPLYHDADPVEAERQINQLVRQAEQSLAARHEPLERRIPRGLPPYLAELYRTPLLAPALERALFLAFNFHKSRFAALRGRLDPHLCRRRDLDLLERHLRLARATKNRIVTANLRLVVSVARKHLRRELDLMELVSDGNIVLMRAVEGFDIHRGFRFSTYATLALVKGFARSVPQMRLGRRGGCAGGCVDQLPGRDEALGHATNRDQVHALLGRLDEQERRVVAIQYGLSERPAGATVEHLTQLLGVSEHRVRQIEQSALTKLRRYAAGAS